MKTKAKRMIAGAGRTARRGFTLIEVLVTLAIVAALVAVLFPIVLDQLDDADPTRTARDLASIRTGIETFQLNVRPETPGDLEDLVFHISPDAGDQNIEGDTYANGDSIRWRGPYLDLATAEAATGTGDAKETGFGGQIQVGLDLFDSGGASGGVVPTLATDADWVIVTILNLSSTQFGEVNAVIDGEETTAAEEGRLRFFAGGGGDPDTTRYLAVPYRP